MTIADTDAKEKQELGLVVGVGGAYLNPQFPSLGRTQKVNRFSTMLWGSFPQENRVLFLSYASAVFLWHVFFCFPVGAKPGPRGMAAIPCSLGKLLRFGPYRTTHSLERAS